MPVKAETYYNLEVLSSYIKAIYFSLCLRYTLSGIVMMEDNVLGNGVNRDQTQLLTRLQELMRENLILIPFPIYSITFLNINLIFIAFCGLFLHYFSTPAIIRYKNCKIPIQFQKLIQSLNYQAFLVTTSCSLKFCFLAACVGNSNTQW